MQNLLIDERKQELSDEGRTDPAQQASDPELQRLEEVRAIPSVTRSAELMELIQRKAAIAWRTLRVASATHLHLYGKIGVNNVEKLIAEIAKPQLVPPHISVATAAVPGTEASNASVKTEDQAENADGQASKADPGTPSKDEATNVKSEEAQEQGAALETVGDHGTPVARDDSMTEAPLSGKRSREASGMAIDETEEAKEQAKKQKVDVDA